MALAIHAAQGIDKREPGRLALDSL